MKIIVDAHGGDNAPREIVKGCVKAVKEYGASITLVGREDEIKKVASEEGLTLDNIEIVHTDDIITMEDDPVSVVRAHKNCSMAQGLKMLSASEGDAFISAGSTGALVVGSRMIVKNIKCIKRAPLATVLPSQTGAYMLLDCGANSECKSEYLRDFAIMGSVYMNGILGVDKPRVAVLSNGTEDHKGTDLTREAKELISGLALNFIGYVEGRDAPLGACDVLVTDGFTGNVYLKTVEGMGKMISSMLKKSLKQNVITMLGAGIASGGLKSLKKQLDYSEYGGAPLLGLNKPVIKAHGTADEKVIAKTIKQAMDYVSADIGGKIADMVALTVTDEAEEI